MGLLCEEMSLPQFKHIFYIQLEKKKSILCFLEFLGGSVNFQGIYYIFLHLKKHLLL